MVTICIHFNSMIVNTFLTDFGIKTTQFLHCPTSYPSILNYLLPGIFTRYYLTIEEIAKFLRPWSLSHLSLFVTITVKFRRYW